MKLQEFMNKNSMSYRDMAKIAKISHSCIYNYANDLRVPSIDVAYKIELATKKKVKVLDLLSDKLKSILDNEFKA